MDSSTMSAPAPPKSHNLFQVFLRLRPPQAGASQFAERFLAVESPPQEGSAPTHITLDPPNDRRRAIEKFAFTQVFEEDATQLDVFHCTGVIPLVEGVLAPYGGNGTDALLATLGVTGSGKTHTILGSKTQRGQTQLALDVIFRSLGDNIRDCSTHPYLEASINELDPSEAAVCSASAFLDAIYVDPQDRPRPGSRAPTPMIVGTPPVRRSASSVFREVNSPELHLPGAWIDMSGVFDSPKTIRPVSREDYTASPPPSPTTQRATVLNRAPYNGAKQPVTPGRGLLKPPPARFMAATASTRKKNVAKDKTNMKQGESAMGPPQTPSRRLLNRPSALPQQPDVSALAVSCDPAAEYAIVISMYEVYNDRIFDLLAPPVKSAATKEYRRRQLLFKPTEASPDRKVVAGLRKVICGNLQQALMVLEAGLHERRVAGTGSNSVSSRSHGFFCVEVKKRAKTSRRHVMEGTWGGSTLTIVDLAGSERARDAKTAGATLAEAGKINESLMYLGQCLQIQSDAANNSKPGVVPFRQCKLTELLFSNSFPSTSTNTAYTSSTRTNSTRNPQKAVMIVTADPHGDFNATSQILRYSALARQIITPRIPSLTQTIIAPPASLPASSPLSSPDLQHSRPFFSQASPVMSRTFSPASVASDGQRGMMETAALEIARMADEKEQILARMAEEREQLLACLAAEQTAHEETNAHLLSMQERMEERMLEMEEDIREEVVNDLEARYAKQFATLQAYADAREEQCQEHFDQKMEILTRGTSYDSDGGEDKENVLVEDIQQENDRLRRENEVLRRELAGMSPSKRMPLRERGGEAEAGKRGSGAGGTEMSLQRKLENLRVSDDARSTRSSAGSVKTGSPTKKVRKLGKRWDSMEDDHEMF